MFKTLGHVDMNFLPLELAGEGGIGVPLSMGWLLIGSRYRCGIIIMKEGYNNAHDDVGHNFEPRVAMGFLFYKSTNK